MIDILFSILVPAYKSTYFRECIESILSQTYKNFELIIVDDASPENLKAIVDKYGDPRIKFYRNEKNCGAVDVVDNWNKCLEYATGDYVICMGDDDMLCSDCLEEYAKLITRYPNYKLFHGRTELINEKGKCISILGPREEVESTLSFVYYRWKGRCQYIGDFCYEINTLRSYGGFYKLPLAWASDDISAVLQAQSSDGVVNCNKILFKYRVNCQSITGSGDFRIKCGAICLEQDWYEDFLKTCLLKNEEEALYFNCLDSLKNKYFQKKRLVIIASDISHNIWHSFFWIKKYKKYRLNHKLMAYAFLMGIAIKVKMYLHING